MTKLFHQAYPDRFYNFGIAESNMAGAAAGMAAAGLTPVISTFAFLLAVRAMDPIHSLIAYNHLNVKLAGGYAGLSDHADGASHQGICDMSILRAIPGMVILSPSDEETTRACVRAMLEYNGPVYLRLSRDVVGSLHGGRAEAKIGKAQTLMDGGDVLIVATGMLVKSALEAAEALKKKGISACVVESVSVKPLDEALIALEAKRCGRVVTLEENNVLGGLGDAVCAAVCANHPVPVLKLGMNDCFGESARSYPELLQKYGLDGASVSDRVREFIGR
jgi:transketolase